MTDQPTRLEVTPEAISEVIVNLLLDLDGTPPTPATDAANALLDRLAHTVPVDAGLREAVKMWLADFDDDRRDLELDYDHAERFRRLLSTSPAVDTNEGLAERVQVKIGIHADDTTYLTETVTEAELALLKRLQDRSRAESPAWGGQLTVDVEARAALDQGSKA